MYTWVNYVDIAINSITVDNYINQIQTQRQTQIKLTQQQIYKKLFDKTKGAYGTITANIYATKYTVREWEKQYEDM